MPHATQLIATIVMGLVFAFAGGFLASKLRLPPLVGDLLGSVFKLRLVAREPAGDDGRFRQAGHFWSS
jgi:hypothetical protein